ncbi:hypothetical protein G7083_11100 [Vibrio sp. HDW18]|uniref:hypothetical protein n=1 Tax=Vibrio sp. HDW18 TaxID=2714948 RepID=UPI00140C5537|nr:hypothetical protein [Vibrio sp. HDW18]QIL86345.1 hypothetical protein G7083_11100 [Vibrio sp. HDW18]
MKNSLDLKHKQKQFVERRKFIDQAIRFMSLKMLKRIVVFFVVVSASFFVTMVGIEVYQEHQRKEMINSYTYKRCIDRAVKLSLSMQTATLPLPETSKLGDITQYNAKSTVQIQPMHSVRLDDAYRCKQEYLSKINKSR